MIPQGRFNYHGTTGGRIKFNIRTWLSAKIYFYFFSPYNRRGNSRRQAKF